jgi:O-antigen ligase
MVEGLFLSFSRGSWLAFTVALLTLMILEWRARQHQREQSVVEPFVLGSTLLAAIALVVLFGTQLGAVTERVLTEAHTTLQVLRGDWSGVESDSVGLRIHALRFAADLWTQRPWLGWGAGSAGELIATSGRPELLEAPGHWLAHLHNTYAELLVQFGLFGSSLLVAMIWLLGRAAFQECRVASDRATLCRYLFVAFVFALIWSLFSYRMTRHDGLFFWILFAGAAYSLRLRRLFWTAQA